MYKYACPQLTQQFLHTQHHISRDFHITRMHHLSYLFLYLSLASSAWSSFSLTRSTLNGPCVGVNGTPGVCISTSSCSDDGGTFISNACPGTPSDIKCCTKASCGTHGKCGWTSQCSGTTVSGLCPGPASFKCCEASSGPSPKIGRSEIISRGKYWISRHVPYSMHASYPDPQGTKYRTDCSGFVSMALHSSAPGRDTTTLLQIATEITWDKLQPGDFVGTLGAGTGGDGGHVTLFVSWTDSTKKRYNSLECRGREYGCIAYQRPVRWTHKTKTHTFTSKPYRYIHVN